MMDNYTIKTFKFLRDIGAGFLLTFQLAYHSNIYQATVTK